MGDEDTEEVMEYNLGEDFQDLTADDAYARVCDKAPNQQVVLCNFTDYTAVKITGIRHNDSGSYLIAKYLAREHRTRGEDGKVAVEPHAVYPVFKKSGRFRSEMSRYARIHYDRVAAASKSNEEMEGDDDNSTEEGGGDDEKEKERVKCSRQVGARIKKRFFIDGNIGPTELYNGEVTETNYCEDKETYMCLVQYDDGDKEHMTADEVAALVKRSRRK